MNALILQIALLLLVAFVVGCVLGCWLRKLFAAEEMPLVTQPAEEKARPAAPAAPLPPAPANVDAAPEEAAEPQPDADEPADERADDGGGDTRPPSLSAPNGGVADDLKKIKGVGPKLEGMLNGFGIYHYDQIAKWTAEEVVWVDDYLKFKGRVEREDWIAQAKALAKDSDAD